MFQNVALSSLISSSITPDYYCVLIDRDLPSSEMRKLKSIVAPFDWVHLIIWDTDNDLKRLDWILERFPISTSHVLTTQLDDDDAVHSHYLKRILEEAQLDLSTSFLSRWCWYGGAHALEWDLGVGNASGGALKPWSGGTSYWQGVGTSLLVPARKGEPTVYSWTHDKIEKVFSPLLSEKASYTWGILRHRVSLAYRLFKRGRLLAIVDWNLFGWIRQMGGGSAKPYDMVISNSGTNLQDIRRDLGKKKRSDVNVLARLSAFGVSAEGFQVISDYFAASSSNSE